CRIRSDCLPICRKISPHASVEPTASPSARACEVSTNRLRSSISLRTSFNIPASALPFLTCASFLNGPGVLQFCADISANDPAENTILADAAGAGVRQLHAE